MTFYFVDTTKCLQHISSTTLYEKLLLVCFFDQVLENFDQTAMIGAFQKQNP